ncbi:hypothetical protein ACLGIH_21955 [Streptomyces sp. HMX87]|uniref:hypothetical protein n=1 Tax=Streptomyces sp. HMX87 TaxID=3390849 RepID=UPI003A8C6B70
MPGPRRTETPGPLAGARDARGHRRRRGSRDSRDLRCSRGPRSPRSPRHSRDEITGLVRWAAFGCLLVPVVLLLCGASPAGAAGPALGLAAVTTACRLLLHRSERVAAQAGAHRGGRHAGGNTPGG